MAAELTCCDPLTVCGSLCYANRPRVGQELPPAELVAQQQETARVGE